MGTTIYFDLVSGASGDMILATLVDLGVPVEYLNHELGKLGIPGLAVESMQLKRSGINCRHLTMHWTTPKGYRHLPDILNIIKQGEFSASIYNRCEAVLDRLADAEAAAHGIKKSEVHFHEIGAVDTIIDIVGTCLALDYLKLDAIMFSTLTEGKGTIKTEHGVMPVPAPATANLMAGFHVTRLDVPSELLTPTGAALLTTLGSQSLAAPEGTVTKTGYGCGTREFDNHPNFLRATLIERQGTPAPLSGEAIDVLETDMDHLTGELMGNVGTLLMEQGALDVSWTSIFMKKNRPGYRLTVIAKTDKSQDLIDSIIVNTRTLGVRVQHMRRVVAEREEQKGTFAASSVNEKLCSYKNHSWVKIENDDLAMVAKANGIPVIEAAERYLKEKGKEEGKINR
jgi:uncharacterized protein (TIGR00299 family) protein